MAFIPFSPERLKEIEERPSPLEQKKEEEPKKSPPATDPPPWQDPFL